MRRTAIVAAVLLAALAALPATSHAAFTLGVAAGEVTSRSAVLWGRATTGGIVRLTVARDPALANVVATRSVRALRSNDLTVQATVRHLAAGTRYWYRWHQGAARSAIGRFETAPAPGAPATVRFAFTGDADATRDPRTRRPAYNRFQVYRRMTLEGNDFNLNFGDTIYSDSEVGARYVDGRFVPRSLARTVPQKWAKYRRNLAMDALADLRGATATYSHWDDHEFVNDFTRAENGSRIYAAGVAAFRDYAPVTYTTRHGLYRSFRWGRNAELFLLDERSFRGAKASRGGTCDNPRSGAPDLAPTAPQASRSLFASIEPSLSAPVSPACLARISDPDRTMLGARQFQAFTTAIQRSTARFKIVMNEVPIQQFYALPYDRWEGYAAERRRLLEVLDDVRNVVFLTTDTHATLVNDVRFQTLEPGGPVDTGIDEFVTGPVATGTFADEIDETLGRRGRGKLVNDAFFKPAPPDGVGMRCSNPDVYSYAQVTVTSTTLTVVAKDLDGRVVRDSLDGVTPCRLRLIAR
jgi:alkaline phosphatase D